MDTDKLVEIVTATIMDRLRASGQLAAKPTPAPAQAAVVTYGAVPAGVLAAGVATRTGTAPSDVEGAQLIVMTVEAFRAFHSGMPTGAAAAVAPSAAAPAPAAAIDLTNKRVVSESDLKRCAAGAGCTVRVCPKAILTALAIDYARSSGITIVRG